MDFKIVCIDDDPDWVDSFKQEIEDHLRRLEYVPGIIQRDDGSDFEGFLSSADIDLILVDHNLVGVSGDELIKVDFAKGAFIDLVYYSQDPTSLQRDLGDFAGRVHTVSRDNVVSTVIDLCTHIHLRYQNVDIMRGLVLSESIAVEDRLERVMVQSFGMRAQHFQRNVLNEGVYDFEKKNNFVQHYLADKFNEVQKEYIRGGKQDGVTKEQMNALQGYIRKMKPFYKDIILPRNTVAHGKRRRTADGRVVIESLKSKNPKIVFTREWVMDFRAKSTLYLRALKDILSMDIF